MKTPTARYAIFVRQAACSRDVESISVEERRQSRQLATVKSGPFAVDVGEGYGVCRYTLSISGVHNFWKRFAWSLDSQSCCVPAAPDKRAKFHQTNTLLCSMPFTAHCERCPIPRPMSGLSLNTSSMLLGRVARESTNAILGRWCTSRLCVTTKDEGCCEVTALQLKGHVHFPSHLISRFS